MAIVRSLEKTSEEKTNKTKENENLKEMIV